MSWGLKPPALDLIILSPCSFVFVLWSFVLSFFGSPIQCPSLILFVLTFIILFSCVLFLLYFINLVVWSFCFSSLAWGPRWVQVCTPDYPVLAPHLTLLQYVVLLSPIFAPPDFVTLALLYCPLVLVFSCIRLLDPVFSGFFIRLYCPLSVCGLVLLFLLLSCSLGGNVSNAWLDNLVTCPLVLLHSVFLSLCSLVLRFSVVKWGG